MSNAVRLACVVVSLCAVTFCQTDTIGKQDIKEVLRECQAYATGLTTENQRLKHELEVLRAKLEEIRAVEEEEDEEDSNESHSRSRGLRNKRGAACDAGTLAAWACAPQCVFKLKGLCGLSLKSICHC